jgi:hypothetical protein
MSQRQNQAWTIALVPGGAIPSTIRGNQPQQATGANSFWNPEVTSTYTMQKGDIFTISSINAWPWRQSSPTNVAYNLNLTARQISNSATQTLMNDDTPNMAALQTGAGQEFLRNFTTATTPGPDDFFTHAQPIFLDLSVVARGPANPPGQNIRIVGWSAIYNPGINNINQSFYIDFVFGDPMIGQTRVDFPG